MSQTNENKYFCPQCPTVLFVKTTKDAVIPTKANKYAVGYDLTAIKVHKKFSEKTTLYDTGIQVKPPPEFYTVIHPRSSISKSGYILSNSTGIIDPDYRGNLYIALTKVDDSVPDLKLPFKCCQLKLERINYFNMVETDELDETERGSGGFGSSDKK